jgi:hypothetical protein
VTKKGKKSYLVGYYDHDHRERTKTCASATLAGEWITNYNRALQHGPESLRRFLLDLDAREANGTHDGRTLGNVGELYFALDADPDVEGGLAPTTFDSYKRCARIYVLGGEYKNCCREPVGRHPFAVRLAALPVVLFNEPHEPRRWREEMRAAGLNKSRRGEAWKVLSVILSWSASSHLIPEVSTNGCLLASERTRSRRRSSRSGQTGRGSTGRRANCQVAAWALTPPAVEAIREQMLLRIKERDPILALRDATVVSTQYGLSAATRKSGACGGSAWRRNTPKSSRSSPGANWTTTARRTRRPNAGRVCRRCCGRTSSGGGPLCAPGGTRRGTSTSCSLATSAAPDGASSTRRPARCT